MDLFVPNNIELTDNLISAHTFLKNSYLNFIMIYPEILNRLLNEYVYHMHKFYNMYSDRVDMKRKKGKENDYFSAYHVMDFVNVMNRITVSLNDDRENSEDFYEYLLDFVDDNLGEKFYYGKKFNEDEIKILQNAGYDCDIMGTRCFHKKIKIVFKKDEFDFDKFHEFEDDESLVHNILIKFMKNKTIITIDNSDHNLNMTELWSIQSCSDNFMTLSIDYKKSTDNILYINAIL